MIRITLAMALCIAVGHCHSMEVWGQSAGGQPVEYRAEFIESASPLPGGGVVASVYFPGQETQQNSAPPVGPAPTQVAARSVLDPSLSAGNVNQGQPQLQSGFRQANLITPRVPSLGVPTHWTYAMRPNCCLPGGTSTLAPVSLSGLTPPAASLPPALPTATGGTVTTMIPPARTQYTPLVSLRNMPPSAYAGQGIFGSPKLYVDGQPVRNLLRYLIVP